MLIFLAYLSLGSVLAPMITWLRRARENYNNPFSRALMIFLVVSAVCDVIIYFLGKIGRSNIEFVNIFFILQFYLLSYMYSTYLKKSSLISISVFGFTLFVLINSLLVQPFSQIQSWSDGLQSVLLIVYSIVCHLHLLKNPSEDERFDTMVFWVNMALMFYFSLNLYLFITSNYVFDSEPSDIGLIFWTFHNCFNIIKNVMLAVGIYYAGVKSLHIY